MTGTRLYLCADIGTSSLKAALIDSAGRPHGFTRVPYESAGAAAATRAEVWLDAFYTAAEQLAEKYFRSGAANAAVAVPSAAAIAISGNGPTLVPETEDEESFAPLYWYDEVPRIAGCPSFFLPKIKHFSETNAELYSRARYFFSPEAWLARKLGARPVTIIPHDAYIPYYWNDEACAALGLDPAVLPPFVPMGTIIGEHNARRFTDGSPAAALLPPGIPIVACPADFVASLIGTGTLAPGAACDRTGSSEGLNLCVETLPDPVPIGIRALPHALSGFWNLGVLIPKSGTLFEEYRARSGETGSHGELVRAIFETPSHSGRPVLETMGRAFCAALETFERAGYSIGELTLSGGQSADPRWNQYKADISGRVLKVPEIIHAELSGNAVLCEAAFTSTAPETLGAIAARMIRAKETYTPR